MMMNDENKAIEEMAKAVCCDYGKCEQCFSYGSEVDPCLVEEDCEKIYNAGYRKESDTAREILEMYRLEDTFSSFREKVVKNTVWI